MLSTLKKYNQTIIIALAAIIITLFAYLTPPGNLSGYLPGSFLFRELKGDLPEYVSRFLLSLLLFGIIPITYIKISRLNFSAVGLKRANTNPLKDRLFPFLILLCLVVGTTSAFDQSLSEFYPYSKTLTILATDQKWLSFLIHVMSYILFYYLPWEIFFRGFLIIPFLPDSESGENEITPGLLLIASFQVIPSSIIHFGHPITETLGAIPFGILCGWLVLKYRSIIPGLILHIITGVTMDLIITIKSGL